MRPDDPADDVPPGSVAAWSTDGGQRLDPNPGAAERYARGGELGRGGMGVVAATVDTWLDRAIAMKRPLAGSSADQVARVAHEARITARLLHPAIPPVYDMGEDAEGPYYTMPVLVGATLHDRIVAGDASLRVLVDAVAMACRAAGYAHAQGVVHRDLKPGNILIGTHGGVWVLDWGVALDAARPDRAMVGTPGFQAPEVLAGEVATPAADVYSLGMTLREVLDRQPAPHPEMRSVVEHATRPDPRDRYPDGAALADDIDRWRDGRVVSAHPYPTQEVLWRLLVRWRAPVVVAAAALGVGLVLGLIAWRAQAAERTRADHSLSMSLAQQAAAIVRTGARPEAEVLAAHAIAIEENPLARGVLMAWGASPPVRLLDGARPACPGVFVDPDGYAICADGQLRLIAPDGRERWSAPLDTPDGSPGRAVGAVVSARHYDGDVVVLRRSSNHIEVWRDGARIVAPERGVPSYLGLADGPVPALYDTRRVGLLDLDTGAITWGPPTCDHIETALVRDDGLLVGCRESRVFSGPWDTPGAPIGLDGSPSALAWDEGPWIGTFEGDVLFPEGAGWVGIDAGVGPVRQLVPVGDGRLAVVGERGRARILAPHDRSRLGTLPHGVAAVAWTSGALTAWGADTARRYSLDADLRPVVFDRTAEGGIGSFDVSPSGRTLAAGSATGDVVTWDPSTGAAQRRASPDRTAAKAVRFLDESTIVHALAGIGTQRIALDGSPPGELTPAFARAAVAYDRGLALLPWSSEVVLVGGSERRAPLPARPIAATVAGSLWVADERGGVHELDGDTFAHRFDLGAPSLALAATHDLLLTADGATLVARGHDGTPRWRWAGTAALTAIDASESWVAAGDVEGRVVLLRPDGTLVARITGHKRRVSAVVLRDTVLYTASWDGLARAWSLEDVDLDGASWVARVTRTWGLSLEEAMAGADAAAAEE